MYLSIYLCIYVSIFIYMQFSELKAYKQLKLLKAVSPSKN